MNKKDLHKLVLKHTQTKPSWAIDAADKESWFKKKIMPGVLEKSSHDVIIKAECYPLKKEIIENQKNFNRLFKIGDIYWKGILTNYNSASASSYHRYGVYQSDFHMEMPVFIVYSEDGRHFYLAVKEMNTTPYYFSIKSLDELHYFKDFEALDALVTDAQEMMRKYLLNAQKKYKIKELKLQAVKAQIDQIAREDGFAYHVETSTRLIVIYVLLDNGNQLRISVPFSNFEAVITELRTTVRSLRALHKKGINFKVQLTNHAKFSWVSPKS